MTFPEIFFQEFLMKGYLKDKTLVIIGLTCETCDSEHRDKHI